MGEFKKGAFARWICDGVNPYEENIPSHVTCHANCHSWTNAAGEMVTAKSTCQSDGTWSKPTAFPGGPLKNPAVLNSPDGPDMECGDCKPLNLTYNPNEEKGTEFYCNPRVDSVIFLSRLTTRRSATSCATRCWCWWWSARTQTGLGGPTWDFGVVRRNLL